MRNHALSLLSFFSVLDLFSDYILTGEYLNIFEKKVLRTVQSFDDPSVTLINSSNPGYNFGKPAVRYCDLISYNTTTNGTLDLTFACFEAHYLF